VNVYELDLSAIESGCERRALNWALTACDAVHGAFLTARDDTLAVLFAGDHRAFTAWVRALAPIAVTTTREELYR
jgi:hypothetical protein